MAPEKRIRVQHTYNADAIIWLRVPEPHLWMWDPPLYKH